MRSLTIVIIAAAIAIFGLVYVVGNPITYAARALNPWYSPVQEHLARAMTAQTPDGIIEHLIIVKRGMPESGYISQWSPEKSDFETIQAQLDTIISRARNISELEPETQKDYYISEMGGMHADIMGIREKVRKECSTLC